MPETMVGEPEFKAIIYSPSMEIMTDAVSRMTEQPHASFE